MTLAPPNSSPSLTINQQSTAAWQGTLELCFAKTNGKTFPVKSYGTSPLRVQRPFYPAAAPENCQSVIVHTAGGMVGGDQLDMTVTAEPETQVLVTTAAAHKVYRSQGDWAQQTIQLKVGAGAYVEWLPQELILFNGGQFQQSLRIDLEPGGIWLGWEITRFGRSARGETLKAGQWRSQTEVWQQGMPLWIDRQQLVGGSEVLSSQNGLAGYPVAGAFLLLGAVISSEHLNALREQLDSSSSTPGEIGITQLEQGLVARYRGLSSQSARQYFVSIWQYLRTQVLGQKAYVPRVWGV
ncbi:urease accessory protein [Leptolyngbya sp. Heron Island J]|uniref:urease accessory protein UreD n=1 Tax=Leptolyngbya sp. Heron Island J TaxID=1385935 RepID=UPI0003B9B41C|nr:urease accessory protein UreD [Leptolyngbya sp. Heron Island J]ESA34427.1 urease accessory protein [Leptolyngbya sp. Heron Island J]